MILDKLSEFCDAVALSQVGTGKAAIGSNLPIGGRNIGQGEPLFLVITVDTTVLSGGAATVAFELVSDAQDPPAADGTETVHLSTGPIPKALLVQGAEFVYPFPMESQVWEAYVGLQQNVAVAALTAGKINAFLTRDSHGWAPQPEGTN